MVGKFVFRVEKMVEVVHYPEAGALVSHWESLSAPGCCAAIERGSNECKRLGAKSWIVDLTRNPGVPSQTDLEWMAGRGVDLAHRNGVVAIINVHGESALATMGSKRWTKGASDGGLETYDTSSVEDALALAEQIAAGLRPS